MEEKTITGSERKKLGFWKWGLDHFQIDSELLFSKTSTRPLALNGGGLLNEAIITVSLFWYFFAEVFNIFRIFFLIVFHVNILFMMLPLAIWLNHRPCFLGLCLPGDVLKA
ncbi:hypothetical protein Pfo_025453 [Paulownia fortunei]|nr:hypothetical protein Pfo_025453 [Paulownia fortunei]